MRKLLYRHTISFKSAYNGCIWALSTQPNFRVHILLSLIAIGLGLYFRITRLEWVIIIFTIVLGMVAEYINTSIEAMTDLITQEWKKEAKIAKDVSAGMMLTVAIGAIAVAVIIFWPHLRPL